MKHPWETQGTSLPIIGLALPMPELESHTSLLGKTGMCELGLGIRTCGDLEPLRYLTPSFIPPVALKCVSGNNPLASRMPTSQAGSPGCGRLLKKG